MAKRKENPMSPSDRGRLGGLSVKNRATLVENKGHEWLVQRGRTQGRKNVESGFMESIRAIESASKGGTTTCHRRWHVARGKPNPLKCELCAEELQAQLSQLPAA
jgi:hypothetical protein